MVEDIALHPEKFEKLSEEEKLYVIAELVLYWDDEETLMLSAESKLGAKKAKDRSKYWTNKSQLLKKQIELETARLRRGV